MKRILIVALTLVGCANEAHKDHYYCNDRQSQAAYERCIEAGRQIEESQQVD